MNQNKIQKVKAWLSKAKFCFINPDQVKRLSDGHMFYLATTVLYKNKSWDIEAFDGDLISVAISFEEGYGKSVIEWVDINQLSNFFWSWDNKTLDIARHDKNLNF